MEKQCYVNGDGIQYDHVSNANITTDQNQEILIIVIAIILISL